MIPCPDFRLPPFLLPFRSLEGFCSFVVHYKSRWGTPKCLGYPRKPKKWTFQITLMWFTKNPMKKYCLAAELCCSGKVLFFEPEIWTKPGISFSASWGHSGIDLKSSTNVRILLVLTRKNTKNFKTSSSFCIFQKNYRCQNTCLEPDGNYIHDYLSLWR